MAIRWSATWGSSNSACDNWGTVARAGEGYRYEMSDSGILRRVCNRSPASTAFENRLKKLADAQTFLEDMGFGAQSQVFTCVSCEASRTYDQAPLVLAIASNQWELPEFHQMMDLSDKFFPIPAVDTYLAGFSWPQFTKLVGDSVQYLCTFNRNAPDPAKGLVAEVFFGGPNYGVKLSYTLVVNEVFDAHCHHVKSRHLLYSTEDIIVCKPGIKDRSWTVRPIQDIVAAVNTGAQRLVCSPTVELDLRNRSIVVHVPYSKQNRPEALTEAIDKQLDEWFEEYGIMAGVAFDDSLVFASEVEVNEKVVKLHTELKQAGNIVETLVHNVGDSHSVLDLKVNAYTQQSIRELTEAVTSFGLKLRSISSKNEPARIVQANRRRILLTPRS